LPDEEPPSGEKRSPTKKLEALTKRQVRKSDLPQHAFKKLKRGSATRRDSGESERKADVPGGQPPKSKTALRDLSLRLDKGKSDGRKKKLGGIKLWVKRASRNAQQLTSKMAPAEAN